TRLKSEELVRKIEKAGFKARLKVEEKEDKGRDRDRTEAEAAHKREKRKLIASLISSGILLIYSMGQMIISGFPVPDILSMETHPHNAAFFQFLLTLPALYMGRRYFTGGIRALFSGVPNMDSLVGISAAASMVYSLVVFFMLEDRPQMVHELYFESAAVVITLVSLGKFLEAGRMEKTRSAIDSLLKLLPETAVLVNEDGEWEVPVDMLKLGDTVLVKAGAKIPADGSVIRGAGSADEAMLTGESIPVDKKTGSELTGGSILLSGAVYMKVEKLGEDTALSKIIRFVEDAQSKKAPVARLADKISGVFVPIVILIALAAGAVWFLLTKNPGLTLKVFTTVLVIACPCALGLATPTAIIVGTGLGAKNGILIRSGEALQKLSGVKLAILDKTGTLTVGEPRISDVVSENEPKLLAVAYSLEKLSDHPIAQAVTADIKAMDIELSLPEITDLNTYEGGGLKGTDTQGNIYKIGNERLFEETSTLEKFRSEIDALREMGKTVIAVSENKEVLGLLAISDKIKDDAKDGVEALKKLGVKPVLLTGDSRKAAAYTASLLVIEEVYAEVYPGEKAEKVREHEVRGETVIMVGDGINDAPALAAASVGCAIGSGSDIAIDSADVILTSDSFTDVSRAIKLGRLSMRTIKQNLFWAFIYNIIGIPIAAGALYP
ncbi:MAG: copper-translocating P-type ATPase, partial [Clostridiales bacterium]|nr:copper-translocating P-type ATPase [Clostridiales bacterium]